MKKSRNLRIVLGLTVALLAIGVGIGFWQHAPAKEITTTELAELIARKEIVSAKISPTIYTGVYTVEGARKAAPKARDFSITTHLSETDLRALTQLPAVKMEVPGQGSRAQWINILSTLFIAGLVTVVVFH